MKLFDASWIAALNAQHDGGTFFAAVAVDLDGVTTVRLANTPDAIVFDGQTFLPRPLTFSGLGQSSDRELPRVSVTLANVDGVIGAFLETTSLLGRLVTLYIFHEDLLGDVANTDTATLEIVLIEWTDEAAVFTCGLNLGLSESLPKNVITRSQFPGVPDSFRRASIL